MFSASLFKNVIVKQIYLVLNMASGKQKQYSCYGRNHVSWIEEIDRVCDSSCIQVSADL